MRHGLIVDRIRAKSWRDAAGRNVFADRDWRLTVLTDRPGPEHEHLDRHTELVVVPQLTTNSMREAIGAAHRSQPLSAISTTSELFLDAVASMRDALGLPGPNARYTSTLRDKWRMKEIARRCGLPHAMGVLGSDVNAAGELLERYGRCIVKPRRLSGSRGVMIIRHRDQLQDWVRQCEDLSSYLVEEFVDGPLLHVDGMVIDGQVTWQLSQYERPTHLAGGRTPLSSFTVDDPIWLERTEEFLGLIVRSWSLNNDVFHCEMFATDRGPIFCELAGRPGGAGVTTVFAATRGIDLRHAKTYLDFGEHVPQADGAALRNEGGWSVFYALGGRFRGVEDNGLNLHYTREIRARRGDVVGGRTFSGVGVATYTFLGDDTQSVRDAIRRYESEVRVLEDSGDHRDYD